MIAGLVSIIIATYRRTDTLKRALESLTEQTYPHIEIVLVNDNADVIWQDKVAEIIEAFQSKHSHTKMQYLVNELNQGSAQTRNIGIRAAAGEYITFLDDDDLYLPSKIENQLSCMLDAGADYSLTDLQLYSESGKLVDRRRRNYIRQTDAGSLLQYHLMYHMTGTDTMMFRSEYLRNIGGFPPIDVGDEFYLMKEAINGGGKFAYFPACDVKAYIHTSGGLSSGENKINGENQLYEYKKTFFNQIDARIIRYIRMRHHAVLAFTKLRRKKYGSFFLEGCISFFCSPFACIKLLHWGKVP